MPRKQYDDKLKKRRHAEWYTTVRMPEARRPPLPCDDVRYKADLVVVERGVPHYVYVDSAMRVTAIKAEKIP